MPDAWSMTKGSTPGGDTTVHVVVTAGWRAYALRGEATLAIAFAGAVELRGYRKDWTIKGQVYSLRETRVGLN